MQIKESLRHDRLQALADGVDAGSVGGKIKGYDGSQPATGGSATTLLFTCTFSTTAFATPSGGSMASAAITKDSSADATATCTWYRVTDSDDVFCWDGPAADLNLPSNSIVSGAEVDITSVTITDPNS